MATPTVYLSTDTSAPVLDGTDDNSLCAVLRACLIDGYGTKAAAGWTSPFNDWANNTAVFRPATGNRPFYRIRDDLARDTSTGGEVAMFSMYESMTDLNTGSRQHTTSVYVQRSYAQGSTTARPWMVIADDAGFYVWTHSSNTDPDFTSSTYHTTLSYFGDVIPADPNDVWGSVALAGSGDGTGSTNYARFGLTNDYVYDGGADDGLQFLRPADGAATAEHAIFAHNFGFGDGGCHYLHSTYVPAYADGDLLPLFPTYLCGFEAREFRGQLPGIMGLSKRLTTFDTGADLLGDGSLVACIYYHYGNESHTVVDITAGGWGR